MSFRVIVSVLVMTALAVSLVGCGAAGSSKDAGPIKIGFLGAKTGDVAIYGLNGLKGLNMAIAEINKAGGILGRQLSLLEEDDAGQKDQALNITTKYVTQDKVAAIIGDPTTGLTRVAGAIANSNQTVIMSFGSTGTGVVEIGPYVFRDTLLDAVATPATAKWLVAKGWKKAALITSKNNDFSVSVSALFRDAYKAAGGELVADESIQDKDTDFSGQVTNIKAKSPDVIFFSGYYTEGGLIMKEVRKQGLKDIVMVGADGLQGADFWKLGGDAVEGSISYAGFSPEQASGKTADFITRFKAIYNEEPDLFAAQAYDAVYLITNAMKAANSADPKVYHTNLAQTKNYDGVSGMISFRDNREPIKSPVYLLQVTGAKDPATGKFSLLEKIPVQ
ncbi:MAG: ABC transporter substrate-binding protein [Symbiobacteriia bacterium]